MTDDLHNFGEFERGAVHRDIDRFVLLLENDEGDTTRMFVTGETAARALLDLLVPIVDYVNECDGVRYEVTQLDRALRAVNGYGDNRRHSVRAEILEDFS